MITLIGGSGFVGTRLARRLQASGKDFQIIDKRPSHAYPKCFREADVRSANALAANIPEGSTIVNLAAEHRDDVRPKSLYDEVNVKGAENICRVASDKGCKSLVFTSSVAVYGFAPPNTDEEGRISPFNDYGRTKYEAEEVYRAWQEKKPDERSLTIIRPTVIFGEGNRGNVYNLFRQIANGRFVMFGKGENRKSMAYVENVAAFLEFCLTFEPGIHTYNYIDKPDFNMQTLVGQVRSTLFGKAGVGLRLPAPLGMIIGYSADLVSAVSGINLPVSSIRVKKFLATTQFETTASKTGFTLEVPIEEGLRRTLEYEFLQDNSDKQTFETE